MQNIKTQSAQPNDADEIARLSAELGYPANAAAIRLRLDRLLNSPNHAVYIAVSGQRVLGWISLEKRLLLESGEIIEITGLVVDAAAKRQGIGRSLVKVAEQWAEGHGASAIRVRSNAAREESHLFYASIGFLKRKTQHAYIKQLSA